MTKPKQAERLGAATLFGRIAQLSFISADLSLAPRLATVGGYM
jgi:hypothetical protein